MKKPTLHVDHPQPRNIQRADIAPTEGYAIVVDGHFKTQFSEVDASRSADSNWLPSEVFMIGSLSTSSPTWSSRRS
jgi:hypothetical protein